MIERNPATGIVVVEEWFTDGSLHRADGPAMIERDPATDTVTNEEWWKDGKKIASPRAAAK